MSKIFLHHVLPIGFVVLAGCQTTAFQPSVAEAPLVTKVSFVDGPRGADGYIHPDGCVWRGLSNDRVRNELGVGSIGMNLCEDGRVINGDGNHGGNIVAVDGDKITVRWHWGPFVGDEVLTY